MLLQNHLWADGAAEERDRHLCRLLEKLGRVPDEALAVRAHVLIGGLAKAAHSSSAAARAAIEEIGRLPLGAWRQEAPSSGRTKQESGDRMDYVRSDRATPRPGSGGGFGGSGSSGWATGLGGGAGTDALVDIFRAYLRDSRLASVMVRKVRSVREHKEGWRLLARALQRATELHQAELREQRSALEVARSGGLQALHCAGRAEREDPELVSMALFAARESQAQRGVYTSKQVFTDVIEDVSAGSIGSMLEKQPGCQVLTEEERARLASQLSEDCQAGRYALMRGRAGLMKRAVLVVGVQLRRSDGLFLVHVTRPRPGEGGEPAAALPGGAALATGDPREGMARWLRERFPPRMAMMVELALGPMAAPAETDASAPGEALPTCHVHAVFPASLPPSYPWERFFNKVAVGRRAPGRASPAACDTSGLRKRAAPPRKGCLAPARVLRRPPPPGCAMSQPDFYQLVGAAPSEETYVWLPQWELDWLRDHRDGATTLRQWLGDGSAVAHRPAQHDSVLGSQLPPVGSQRT